MPEAPEHEQTRTQVGRSGIEASAVGLGTWAIGGWMWGGTDAARSIRAIHAAVDEGVSPSASPPAPTRSRRSALRCAAGTSRR